MTTLPPIITGATRSPIDPRDISYESLPVIRERILTRTPLPERYDLRSSLKGVRDQGEHPVCVAMACAALIEYRHGLKTSASFSPKFIYLSRNYSHLDGYPVTGMTVRDGLKIVQKLGCCREGLCPLSSREISMDAIEDAKKFTIDGYARVDTIEGAKEAIYSSGPLIAVFPVYNQSRRFWIRSKGEYLRAVKAVNLVGWTSLGFIVRNTWGDGWADGGHSTYLYGDWSNEEGARHYEIWTEIDGRSRLPLDVEIDGDTVIVNSSSRGVRDRGRGRKGGCVLQ